MAMAGARSRQAPLQRQMLSRRQLLGYGAAGGATLLLSACSQQDGPTAVGSGGSPKSGGTLKIVQSTQANPVQALNQAIPNQSWRRAVYDTLIDYDPAGRKIVPCLATAWEQSPDAKTLTFTLRDKVSWHSGRAFTGADVEYSIKAATTAKPAFALSWALQDLQGIDVKGNSVTLTFAQPAPYAYDALSLLVMTDSESHAEYLKGTKHVGTGPFAWDSFVPNNRLTLRRNEKYWGESRPYLDGIEVRFITRPEALVATVRSNQSDLGLNLLPLDRRAIEREQKLDVVAYSTFGAALYAGANVEVAPLDRKEVRQAINYAIDRARINDELYQGQGKPVSAPWSPTSNAFDDKWSSAYHRDLDKAKQLLSTVGPISAPVVIEAGSAQSRAAEIVAYNLGEIGLQSKINILEQATITDRFQNRTFAGIYLAFHGWNTLSPIDVVYSAAPYKVKNNLFRFQSVEYARLADSLAKADAGTQRPKVEALTNLILDEAFCLDLVHTTNNAVTQKSVHDWSYNIWDEMLFANAWKG
jgi:peptide/nickel transport system substrate-binding protein